MHPYTVAPSPGSLVPSPNATVFPQVLTPATSSTVNKPLAPMPGMGYQPPISINKQWVLPPKPKPGRKPAIDTPPTKRKAQNREAQRAFRERRAAKVGELEEEMRRMEEEDRKEQEELRDRIKQLENDVDQYSHMVMKWQERYREREMECEAERQGRKFLENEIELLRKGMVDGTDAVPLPPRSTRGYAEDQSTKKQDATDHTCGNCDGDYCKCVDDALKASAYSAEDATAATFKRPHSPPSSTDNKRSRHASDLDNNTEIDFTYQFATPPRPTLSTSASTVSIPAVAPPDPCGFCDDGTACLCAEMAKDKAFSDDLKPPPPSLPPPIQNPTKPAPNTDKSCINGPGTCKQCLSSPLSTLFCKSVAAANRIPFPPPPNPPNESEPPQTTAPSTNTPTTTTTTEPTLTCADAFTTLSRHPAFNLASNELGTWVPQLAAGRRAAMSSRPDRDRTAYEIEAASVMSVLRFFDRRFGGRGDGGGDRGGDGNEEGAKNGTAYEGGREL